MKKNSIKILLITLITLMLSNPVLCFYENTLNNLKSENFDISKKSPEETIKNLKRFEETVPQIKKEENYSFDDWIYKGASEYGRSKYNKAIESWTKAIEKNPKSPSGYNNRGVAYYNLKQYERAIEDYNKAIELDAKYSLAYYNRGAAYYKLKQYERAIEGHNKAIELDPENVFAIQNISELKIITGNYESALDSIAKGLSLQLEIRDKAINLYLECTAKKLLNMDTSICEKEFNEILKKDFTIDWSFEIFEFWLKDADIDNNTRRFIKEKTKLIKKHLFRK